MKTKLPYNKFGLACNPVGAQVSLNHGGQMLLGDVVGVYYDDGPPSAVRLIVNHFCGDKWPIDPVASAVDVFVREYESAEK